MGWNPFKRSASRAASTKAPNPQLDAETIAQLRKAGSDIEKRADVVYYLYFPREADAKKAGQTLIQKGCKVQVRPGATGKDWLCLANEQMAPTPANIEKRTAFLEQLATSNGGEFDGWEASVEK